ncbi:MAG TPA: hypothetical protein VGK26_04395 [Thermoanaerobaculia bacterium]|jgi:hypothetical protein
MNLTKKTLAAWVALASALTLATACTNKQGETESPVFLTVDLTDQAGLTNILPARTLTIPTITITSHLKNPGAPDTAGFATVQLADYTVTYRRADGGTIVPPVQQFAVGETVASGGSVTLSDFPVLSQGAMAGTPFDQLLPFNGGIDRETGNTEIRMFYDVVFFGQTVSGFRVQSETATGLRIFVAQ